MYLTTKQSTPNERTVADMEKSYPYEFCLKAANCFFEKGNYKLFIRFYKLGKAEQNKMKQAATVAPLMQPQPVQSPERCR